MEFIYESADGKKWRWDADRTVAIADVAQMGKLALQFLRLRYSRSENIN